MLAQARTVLLADDQSMSREQLRDVFRCVGCTVVAEARNTDDALEKFERLEPDVVIMDVTLLGTIDALVAIQRMNRRTVPVLIFATGTASQSATMMEAMTMGAVDFLMKPFQQQSVRSCLERNLG